MLTINGSELTRALDWLGKVLGSYTHVHLVANKDNTLKLQAYNDTRAAVFGLVASNCTSKATFLIEQAPLRAAIARRKSLELVATATHCEITSGSYRSRILLSQESFEVDRVKSTERITARQKLKTEHRERLLAVCNSLSLTNYFSDDPVCVIVRSDKKGFVGGAVTNVHCAYRTGTGTELGKLQLALPVSYIQVINHLLSQPEDVVLATTERGHLELSNETFWLRLPAVEVSSDLSAAEGFLEHTNKATPSFSMTVKHEQLEHVLENINAVLEKDSRLQLSSVKGALRVSMSTARGDVEDRIVDKSVRPGMRCELEMQTLFDVLGHVNRDFTLERFDKTKNYNASMRLTVGDDSDRTYYLLAEITG